MRKDDFDKALTALHTRATQGAGVLESKDRSAVASGADVPEALKSYAEKVRLHAYKVTDEDVADLIAAGYSEDAIFEATVSAAVGAGMKRWSTAKAAMETGAD